MRDTKDVESRGWFGVDGEIVRYLPRGGATLKHPDAAERPTIERDGERWFLQLRIGQNTEGSGERSAAPEVIRRIPLDNLSEEDWENLKLYYNNIDFQDVIDKGLVKSFMKITDRKVQRMFIGLLTFLDPRQVSILLYLYRSAWENSGPVVYFGSNDLLESLGYQRSNEGTFPSNLRAQLSQDLWKMHSTQLVFEDPEQDRNSQKVRYMVRSILTIQSFEIDRELRQFNRDGFNIESAADSLHLADAYTGVLNFFKTIEENGSFILLPKDINLKQKDGLQASRNYRMKLFTLLLSYITRDDYREGQYLCLMLQDLLADLELQGSNSTRKKATIWKAINELKQSGDLLDVRERTIGRKTEFQFLINKDRISKNAALVGNRPMKQVQ